MVERLSPKSADDVRDVVAWAAGDVAPDALDTTGQTTAGTNLEIIGGGTKRGWGGEAGTNHVLDVSGLCGVSLYEPDELVLSAAAGTPLADIENLLAEKNQQLAFEPPDLGPLWGQPAGAQTIGGVVAANLSGPRRIRAGAARDHFLGFQAVTGRAELVRSGGRVVKNVTGYDLCKLFAGSFGTLGVLTELTVKVLPAGEKTRTILVYGLEDGVAIKALTQALNAAHDVSGAAHLPGPVAARSAVGYAAERGDAVTAVRVEGVAPSVLHRAAALREMLAKYGDVEELHGQNSASFWREVGNVVTLLPDPSALIWRLSVPPKLGAAIIDACSSLAVADWYFDWGGGLIWLSVAADLPEGGAGVIRSAIDQPDVGGHATLMRAPAELRRSVPPFQPQASGVAALAERIRQQFDPLGLFNPGRMAPLGSG